jgi:hypothetical protein
MSIKKRCIKKQSVAELRTKKYAINALSIGKIRGIRFHG